MTEEPGPQDVSSIRPNSAYSDLAVLPDGRVAVMLEKDWWGSLGLAILPAPPSDPPAPEKNK